MIEQENSYLGIIGYIIGGDELDDADSYGLAKVG
jgi:hypothetical protein